MRCPACGHREDRVVDSRETSEGEAIRRRRECLACGRRYTTFERLDTTFMVRKRSGRREPFDRQKVVAGVLAAGKNRPISADDAEELAAAVESALVVRGPEVSSAAVGREVLLRLRSLDEVAYLRFASVYKGFAGPGDFAAELGLLGDPRPPSR